MPLFHPLSAVALVCLMSPVVTNRWRIHRLWLWLRFHTFLKWMLCLCSICFRLITLVSTCIVQLPFAIVCSGMLSFAPFCWIRLRIRCVFAFECFLRFGRTWFHLLPFVFSFLEGGAFAFVLLSVFVVCSRSHSFALFLASKSQSNLWESRATSQWWTNRWRAHKL